MRHLGTYVKSAAGWTRVRPLDGEARYGLGIAIDTRDRPGLEIELLLVAFVIPLGR